MLDLELHLRRAGGCADVRRVAGRARCRPFRCTRRRHGVGRHAGPRLAAVSCAEPRSVDRGDGLRGAVPVREPEHGVVEVAWVVVTLGEGVVGQDRGTIGSSADHGLQRSLLPAVRLGTCRRWARALPLTPTGHPGRLAATSSAVVATTRHVAANLLTVTTVGFSLPPTRPKAQKFLAGAMGGRVSCIGSGFRSSSSRLR